MTSSTSFVIAYVTTPNEEVSIIIAKAVVEKGLAACVNIIPRIRSIYSWKGELCDDREQLLIIKTRQEKNG